MTSDGTLKGDLTQAYERGGWNAVADMASTLTTPAVHPLLRCDCDEPCGMAGCEPGLALASLPCTGCRINIPQHCRKCHDDCGFC